MKAERKPFPDWVFAAALGGAIPVILVVSLLASQATVLWQTLVALLGIFLAVMALAVYTMNRAGAGSAVETENSLASLTAEPERADPDSRPDLMPELLDWMPRPAFWPATVAALRATGDCPHDYKPGQTWIIDDDGHISRPLCRPAVAVLSQMFASGSREEPGQEAPCACPFADRQVVFAIQSNAGQ